MDTWCRNQAYSYFKCIFPFANWFQKNNPPVCLSLYRICQFISAFWTISNPSASLHFNHHCIILQCTNLHKCKALHKAITQLGDILQRREVRVALQLPSHQLWCYELLNRVRSTGIKATHLDKSALPWRKPFAPENVRLICLFKMRPIVSLW